MVLSKRERYIAIGVGAAIALFGLDQWVVQPYFDKRKEVVEATAKAADDLKHHKKLKEQKVEMRKVWDAMNAGGLQSDAGKAESQARRALNDWAQEAGLTLSDYKADPAQEVRPTQTPGARTDKSAADSKFITIGLHATGTGNMRSVARFLWRVETTTIPMRVENITVTPKREGTDDLQVQLNLSTLCVPNKDNETPAPATPRAAGASAGTADARGERS